MQIFIAVLPVLIGLGIICFLAWMFTPREGEPRPASIVGAHVLWFVYRSLRQFADWCWTRTYGPDELADWERQLIGYGELPAKGGRHNAKREQREMRWTRLAKGVYQFTDRFDPLLWGWSAHALGSDTHSEHEAAYWAWYDARYRYSDTLLDMGDGRRRYGRLFDGDTESWLAWLNTPDLDDTQEFPAIVGDPHVFAVPDNEVRPVGPVVSHEAMGMLNRIVCDTVTEPEPLRPEVTPADLDAWAQDRPQS